MKKLAIGLLLGLSACAATAEPTNGEAKQGENGVLTMWDSNRQSWLNVEPFWLEYAKQNGGLTWGKTDSYPDYDKVNEGDKILIQLAQGNCLMEFFHSRWRRANDVRRWNDQVNNFGGCPHVFE
ncbi:hypothetical protein D5R81_15995 [Parashewanella spongiae]|uniref:Uncharacterized protein n=1 Tax=Parashewanella spongiae TaxID=342950 RepID=A0A3A6TQX1_9GAMM|nr:hypothetical protein [Parashewanella spongiae]MCL1079531.1 hypothetical protein [Parashewanella spongiae]RJY07355.1 hypothetical protein D5R81_15995 [Parashewanella spongiae]